MMGVGTFYQYFDQVRDDEVTRILASGSRKLLTRELEMVCSAVCRAAIQDSFPFDS